MLILKFFVVFFVPVLTALKIRWIKMMFKLFAAVTAIMFTINSNVAAANGDDEAKKENANKDVLIDVQSFVDDAIYYAHIIGLIIRCKEPREHRDKSDIAEFVPFALYPSPFPRKCYTEAMDLQKAMNLLYFRISQDNEFLFETLSKVAETNKIIREQLDILRQVTKEGVKQPYTMLLGRSDYMCHVNDDNSGIDEGKQQHYSLKQIEMNIGAIGGYGRATRATKLHLRTMEKLGEEAVSNDVIPLNNPEGMVADMLFQSWKRFGDPNAILLIVVGRAFQTFEQKQVELLLEEMSKKKMKIIPLSLDECDKKLVLDETDFSLRLDGRIIGVVYFRTIIVTPQPFHLSARRKIERSTAIKCPTVAQELASSKKVQQVLSLPNTVERFFPKKEDAATVAAIRSTFAGLWGLDNDDTETKDIINEAIQNPDKYVLKPSEEGGGNNYWGQQIREKLRTFSKKELSAHILMQRLKPLVIKNFLVRPLSRPVKLVNAVSELSIFGYLIANGNTVEKNVAQGHMVRTKQENITEGGIGAGGGVHDSPYLF